MTTITLPRALLEQALEALKDDQYRLVEVSPNQYEYKTGLLVEVGPNQYEYKTDLAIAALERALAQQAEPVEPVYLEVCCDAHPKWMRVDEQQFDEYVANGWKGRRLYTAPPQRKPLTEEEIRDLWSWSMTAEAERTATTQQHAFTRAVERAHGITDPQVADSLARHGIPMPDDENPSFG